MADDYIPTVGDGAISGDTVTRVWMCKKDKANSIFKKFKHNEEYDDGFFNRQSSSIAYGESYATLTLVFQESEADQEHADGDVIHTCNASTFEKPLEELSNYRTIWNHDIWIKNGAKVAGTNWDFKNETTTVVPAALQSVVKWGDSDTPPEGWYVGVAKTKPGVQAYNYPAPVITATSYFKRQIDAIVKLRSIGRLSAPSYCFGYNTANKYWLINNSSMSRENKLWVVTTEHIYADGGWDQDIYSE